MPPPPITPPIINPPGDNAPAFVLLASLYPTGRRKTTTGGHVPYRYPEARAVPRRTGRVSPRGNWEPGGERMLPGAAKAP
ncbi:hypothetical protein SASPL_111980 [Salvia splendens]|uniref:Uncharacterized protein n=1 Tax=Salvia splendens TaxID=180675 RepID=A0A8X8Y887_SALSN|nr:hypothetical protein SASPL_111980 [Salvia splendens]